MMPGKLEIRQNFLQVADIRRRDETRQEIDRNGRLAALGHLLHHRLDRGVKTFHVGAAVAGGGDRHDLRRLSPASSSWRNSRTNPGTSSPMVSVRQVVATPMSPAPYLVMTFLRPCLRLGPPP